MEGVMIMPSVMSWKEIQEKYPSTWVGLVNVEWANLATIKAAEVKCTDADYSTDELALMTVRGELETICYTTPDEHTDIGAVTI